MYGVCLVYSICKEKKLLELKLLFNYFDKSYEKKLNEVILIKKNGNLDLNIYMYLFRFVVLWVFINDNFLINRVLGWFLV